MRQLATGKDIDMGIRVEAQYGGNIGKSYAATKASFHELITALQQEIEDFNDPQLSDILHELLPAYEALASVESMVQTLPG